MAVACYKAVIAIQLALQQGCQAVKRNTCLQWVQGNKRE